MAETVSISLRLPKAKARKVERLAKATEKSKSAVIGDAVDAYLQDQEWQLAHIKKGLDQIRRGEGISHERVAQWLESWGTGRHVKRPR